MCRPRPVVGGALWANYFLQRPVQPLQLWAAHLVALLGAGVGQIHCATAICSPYFASSMPLNLTPARQLLAAFSLLAGLGLSGCTEKEVVAPESKDCDTMAVVRLCPGNTAACPTEHTTLELPDGARLRPTGPLWEAYQIRQIDGQPIRISYTIIATSSNATVLTAASERAATAPTVDLTCMTELSSSWCGTR